MGARVAAVVVCILLAPPVAGAAPPVSPRWDATRFLSVEEIEPGMTGVGRSVFRGSEIEEFEVEILGVLRTSVPRGDMILARVSGQGLEESGIVAGMSGSPVFIDGKLIGALAFGWSFATEPIAGITPIAEMFRLSERRGAEIPTPGEPQGWSGLSPERWSRLWSAEPEEALDLLVRHPGVGGARFTPLQVPLGIGGLGETAAGEASRFLERLGFLPTQGGISGAGSDGHSRALVPGSAVGVELVRGDATLAAIGTVTWVEGKTVFAFGHRMLNMGAAAYPMAEADIVTVLPRASSSFKMGSTGKTVGAITRDYRSGVVGVIGSAPRMIPVEVELEFARGGETLRFEILDAEGLTPVLAGLVAMSSMESLGPGAGSATLRIESELTLEGGRTIGTRNRIAGFTPPASVAGEVARLVGLVHANPFVPVGVNRIRVQVALQDDIQAAFVDQVSIGTGPHRPGDRVPIRVVLRDYRGTVWSHETAMEIPRATRPGTYTLSVCDGIQAQRAEEKRAPSRFAPQSLESLIRLLETRTPYDVLVLRLLDTAPHPVVSGQELPRLPRSLAPVVKTPLASGRIEEAGATVIGARSESLGKVLLGCRSLELTVTPAH